MERIKPDSLFFLSSREADWPENNIFKGMAITHDAVILNEGGYSKWLADQKISNVENQSFVSGRYALVNVHNENEFSVETDSAGMELLFLYRCGNCWAISNSFLFLAEKVKLLNWKLTLYPPAFYGMYEVGSMSAQLISGNTLFEEIQLVPSYKKIIANKNSTQIILEKITRGNTVDEYEESICEFYSRYASVINSIKENDIPLYADLSGGVDSRVTFSLALASGNKKYVFSASMELKKILRLPKIWLNTTDLNWITKGRSLACSVPESNTICIVMAMWAYVYYLNHLHIHFMPIACR